MSVHVVLVASFALLGEALGRALHFGSHSSLLQLDGVFQRTGESTRIDSIYFVQSVPKSSQMSAPFHSQSHFFFAASSEHFLNQKCVDCQTV